MIDFSNVKSIEIPQGNAIKIEVNGLILWELQEVAKYTNQVPLSIDTDGSIYNSGLGYKNGYRLSSSGGESTSTYSVITGFIKAKGGDVIRIKGITWYDTTQSTNYLNAYNSSFTKVYTSLPNGDYQTSSLIESMELVDGVSIVKLKMGISIEYIRISVYDFPANGSDLIVTVNEEITD